MPITTPTLTHATLKDWERVYEPAEDTFLLIDSLEIDLPLIKEKQPAVVLEVGCGSGIVITALSSTLGTNSHCLATDINLEACRLTRRTAEANGAVLDILQVDLASFRDGSLDMVVFNPPYVPTSSEEIAGGGIERSWAGGHRGREIIDKFIQVIIPLISPGGLGYLLLLEDNNPEEVCTTLRNSCYVKKLTSRRIRGEFLHVIRFEKIL